MTPHGGESGHLASTRVERYYGAARGAREHNITGKTIT
jgi:hypothetical protein